MASKRKRSSPLIAAGAGYLDAMRARFLADPDSVEAGWRTVLEVLEDLDALPADPSAAGDDGSVLDAIRVRGHMAARLDPLGRDRIPARAFPPPEMATRTPMADRLRALYGGPLTIETGHIDDSAVRETLIGLFESGHGQPDVAQRRRALALLSDAEAFEHYLGVRHPTRKRFGAEGAEAVVPLIDHILRQAAAGGVTDVRVATMHRARLNLMANVFGLPLSQVFAEFGGLYPFSGEARPAADVAYHLGHDTVLDIDGRALRVVVAPNPSHLEAINPVAAGRARAAQDRSGAPGAALCLVLHTDASMVGQGVVAETLQLAGVPGYSVAGTVHVVINNQIGFTTEPDEARTSVHCTGPFKAIDSAIVHVNADDIDAVLQAGGLAMAFRQDTGRDVVIDLVCYRRNGHNEIDEPRFTQPLDYAGIDRHPAVRGLHAARLVDQGVVTAEAADGMASAALERVRAALDAAPACVASRDGAPAGIGSGAVADGVGTGVAERDLRDLLAHLSTWPEGLTIDRKLARQIGQRAACADTGIPWALGEALAIGSLLTEGTPVRLAGQDVVRGAFSHRHFALTDTRTGRRHISLTHLAPDQARFDIVNSPLSEYAVLGFEYGYSVERPDTLTIWEAQFGDFANGAQIIIDQFITSAEDKWRQPSGLVMLLPHGLEGQGPEHSSARMERFLEMAALDNLRIVHPTTPANYFHLLRHQARSPTRKPLVVFSPKTLLRLPAAVSPLAAFRQDAAFAPVLSSGVHAEAERVLLCSGKLAYALEARRDAAGDQTTAILRLEQLYPLAEESLIALFQSMPRARVAWVQEEPRNMGAWSHLAPRLGAMMARAGGEAGALIYVGRPEATSPAGSFHGRHSADQDRIIEDAFLVQAARR